MPLVVQQPGRLLPMMTPIARRPACFDSTALPTGDREVLDERQHAMMGGVFPFVFFWGETPFLLWIYS
jgi:hypothetical protein